ncbi:MAG: YgiQ family radical SAM protein [Ruminococcaceae bacterium]|nr:YgiQ family radical SAM protein [Oscillospiraceae bacterium]
MAFLPIQRREMERLGWDAPDFVYVIGDAYVDHPSFGPAIISRVLESHGYRVAIISQPDWKQDDSIAVFGRPKLGFLVSSGNMDSMVNHYTVAKKRRSADAYTPGGEIGKRPDRAVTVYCNLIRKTYKDVPIVIGGIEASLRRMAHYDYWSDSVRRSVLLDSQADLLIYGMGENAIAEIADALAAGQPASDITEVRGTVYRTRELESVAEYELLPEYEAVKTDRKTYAESFYRQYQNTDPVTAKRLVEPYGREYVVQNPPSLPLTQAQMDAVYALPYMRTYHPSYAEKGGVSAISEVKFSLTSCRGCFGACNFCALTFHQGRIIQSRSHESLLREAELMTADPDFKGYIHDVGGPTANFRKPACKKQLENGACRNRQCLFPRPCPNLDADHSDYLALLRKLRKVPGVKKVFVRSGIRFDYVLAGKNEVFTKELCEYHVSGQLKLAPEHVSDQVLRYMGKPKNDVYLRFVEQYEQINKRLHMKQFVEPYLMSSHPGSGLPEAIELAQYLHAHHMSPEQVQDFYPTPSTISTCMYYTGLDPRTMEPVYVAKNPHEKAMQRALIQYRDPKNWALVREALLKAGREDLIGFGPDCLIRPRAGAVNKAGPTGKPGSGKPAAHGGKPAHGGHHGPAKGRTTSRKSAAPPKKDVQPAYLKSQKKKK